LFRFACIWEKLDIIEFITKHEIRDDETMDGKEIIEFFINIAIQEKNLEVCRYLCTIVPETISVVTFSLLLTPSSDMYKLLERNNDQRAKDDINKVLLNASFCNYTDIAKYLLDHRGADIETRDVKGKTPLLLSMEDCPDPVFAKTLIQDYKANVKASDNKGISSLHIIGNKGWETESGFENAIEIASLLIENGADLLLQEQKGRLPFEMRPLINKLKIYLQDETKR